MLLRCIVLISVGVHECWLTVDVLADINGTSTVNSGQSERFRTAFPIRTVANKRIQPPLQTLQVYRQNLPFTTKKSNKSIWDSSTPRTLGGKRSSCRTVSIAFFHKKLKVCTFWWWTWFAMWVESFWLRLYWSRLSSWKNPSWATPIPMNYPQCCLITYW